jgi:hypothetical protein
MALVIPNTKRKALVMVVADGGAVIPSKAPVLL